METATASHPPGDTSHPPKSVSEAPPGDSSRVTEKPYSPPSLQCYGRLADLTQFGGSQVVDSGAGNLGQA